MIPTNVHLALIVCCLALNVFILQTVQNMTESVTVLLALVVTIVDNHVIMHKKLTYAICAY